MAPTSAVAMPSAVAVVASAPDMGIGRQPLLHVVAACVTWDYSPLSQEFGKPPLHRVAASIVQGCSLHCTGLQPPLPEVVISSSHSRLTVARVQVQRVEVIPQLGA